MRSFPLSLLPAFALLTSCGDAPPSAAATARAPVVTLVTAGAEPRAVFASTFAQGATQTVRLTQSSSLSVFADGKTVPETGVPPLALEFAVDVVERAEADARLRFVVTHAAIEDAPWADASARHMLEQELKTGTILGLGGFIAVGARGTTRGTTTNLPARASTILRQVLGQMRQSLEQCVVPWPSAAIGEGARWTIVRPLDLSGIELTESATWTVARREGGVWHLVVEFEYAALGRVVHLPGMPADAQLDLIEFRGTGKGTVAVDAASPLPRDATIDSTLDLKSQATVKDRIEPIDATIHLRSVLTHP